MEAPYAAPVQMLYNTDRAYFGSEGLKILKSGRNHTFVVTKLITYLCTQT